MTRKEFAELAGESIFYSTGDFGLLRLDELVEAAGRWYDACFEATQNGNFGLLEDFVAEQAQGAVRNGFELEDLFAMLRQFRRLAMEKAGWREEPFVEIDAAINEALAGLRGRRSQRLPRGFNYLAARPVA